MNPIEFKEMNCVYAKNQPPYLPLPCHKTEDGIVTSCWRLTLAERIRLLFSGRIWLSVMTFNQSLQPLKPQISNPFTEEGGAR